MDSNKQRNKSNELKIIVRVNSNTMKAFIMNKSTKGIFLNYQRKIKILLYRKL